MSEPIPDCAETEIPVLERLRRENTALAERLKACEAERDTLKADLARVTADKAERERDILRTENARLRW